MKKEPRFFESPIVKMLLFLILGFFLVGFFGIFVSADVISINSGGDNSLILNPQKILEESS
jgi:uncharacterized membrane protein YraQ (UPF0718 family)